MAKRMLIDATHPEETRVVVYSGNRLENFDYETASKKQLKGNIYLAKITRVEPSLQAAFVDYGGNRHGFLPFSEIHPDYYRIPIADREALIAEELTAKGEAGDDDENGKPEKIGEPEDGETSEDNGNSDATEMASPENDDASETGDDVNGDVEEVAVETSVDTVGGDDVDETAHVHSKLLGRYKIQEVIKRRQVILIQVTKEERGAKGAALTTYLSLAGRYCVLMPNTAKGGGISRKISNVSDRRRLKKVVGELKIPEGIAVIVRTAGSQRSKLEIRRDYEYLLRLWGEIRETTLNSVAPSLIYEEANLIKRAIRDLYSSDMEDILVEGENGYKAAKAFMKSLMPSHAKKVQLYSDPTVPLYHRYQVEAQIDAMHNTTVRLKSGGSIVINLTEALVAVDVNSGKATRERHIEETALKTNVEAAEEVARQLRLRDLAGLIVIDFIDMEESRNNREVERRFKEAMRHDRARIQLGRISPFGLLEMSRQRLRPSLFESSTVSCPHCDGTGHVRTTDSTALHVLRGIEEEGIRRPGGDISVTAPNQVALYILNQKRSRLAEIEQRYGFRVHVESDDALIPPNFIFERLNEDSAVPEERQSRPELVETSAAEEKPSRRRDRGRGRSRRKNGEDFVTAKEEATDTKELVAESDNAVSGAVGDDDEDKPRSRRRRGKRGGRRRSRRRMEATADSANEMAAGDGVDADSNQLNENEAPGKGVESAAELEATDGAIAAVSPDAEADGEEAEKPRRRTRSPRRRKTATRKAVEGKAVDEAGAEASDQPGETETPEAAETPGDTDTDAKPKRRRRSTTAKRSPRKKSKAAAKTAEAEPAPQQKLTNGGDAEHIDQESPAAMPVSEAAPSTAVTKDSDDNGEAAAPKRRGWWSRWS